VGDCARLDPREAAMLLGQARREAQRRFEPSPPWLLATRAVLVLAAFGAVWLSVRGQHPYNGPTAAALLVVAVFVVANFGATVAVAKRATAGVSGRSRLRPAEITVMATRADRRACGTALAVAVVGAAGAFAGPAGAWAVVGVGLCLTMLGTAAAVAWKQRRIVVTV